MTTLDAHLICLALVALNAIVRVWRIKGILRGLGHPITAGEAFTLNMFGDAACALTPLRIGGEPARLAGMLRARVPAAAAFVAISLEVLAAWPVVIAAVGWLIWMYAPNWWAVAGPNLIAAARRGWPLVAAVLVVSLVAWLVVRRVVAAGPRQLRRPVARVRVYWRRTPIWPLVVSVPLSLLEMASRVAILPVLALTLPDPPAIGPLAIGSVALLYSQLLLPTPSGAGAVELGFLGGAAGDLGTAGGWLLLAWRFYTNGVGVIVGIWLAVRIYGWPALRAAVRRASGAGAEPQRPSR